MPYEGGMCSKACSSFSWQKGSFAVVQISAVCMSRKGGEKASAERTDVRDGQQAGPSRLPASASS